jgi:hypothetical protein
MTQPDLSSIAKHQSRRQKAHPKGWEPGIQWNGQTGALTVQAADEPDPSIWKVLIEDWGLDPQRVQIVPGSLQIRAWDANLGEGNVQRLKYYRATLQPRESSIDRADVEALIKFATKKRPGRPLPPTSTGRSFVALLTDWQVGNGEAGGSQKITENILGSLDRTLAKAKELRKLGRGAETVYLPGLGDLAEGCNGWYANQVWSTDLNIREQDRLVRHLLLAWIDAFVDAQFRVVAFGVPGNHGEQRANGKAYTNWATDNRDVQVFEIVAEALAHNTSRYGEVYFPDALDKYDMTATLDISGIPVSTAHGHQFGKSGGGGSAMTKIEGWLKGQALGRQPVADCQILFCGHLHHYLASEGTSRTVFQAPASDTGSAWFTQQTGKWSPAGVLTMNVGTATGPRGWNDLAIL